MMTEHAPCMDILEQVARSIFKRHPLLVSMLLNLMVKILSVVAML